MHRTVCAAVALALVPADMEWDMSPEISDAGGGG